MFDAPRILIDCSFDKFLSKKNSCIVSRQIIRGFSDNRKSVQPLDIHCTNVDMDTTLMQEMKTMMPNLFDSMLETHTEDVTDLYPKEELVYLSQHSPNTLAEYNPQDTYIIGGLVDKGHDGPATLGRAKQLGIRHAWLPLEQHLTWGCADRGLPLNIIINILLDVKNNGGDWKKAFKHVPSRKVIRTKERQQFRKYSWGANDSFQDGHFRAIELNTPKEGQNEEELPFSPVQRSISDRQALTSNGNKERGGDSDWDGGRKLTTRDPFK